MEASGNLKGEREFHIRPKGTDYRLDVVSCWRISIEVFNESRNCAIERLSLALWRVERPICSNESEESKSNCSFVIACSEVLMSKSFESIRVRCAAGEMDISCSANDEATENCIEEFLRARVEKRASGGSDCGWKDRLADVDHEGLLRKDERAGSTLLEDKAEKETRSPMDSSSCRWSLLLLLPS
jgi:hypothetical protein